MPSVHINVAALLVAVAINMVVGFVWYAPQVMGKTWQKLVGLSDSDMKNANRVAPILSMLILAFVEIFVLKHFISYTAYYYPTYSDASVGLITGIWVWLGFVFPVLAGSYMFAQRRKKLLAIDSGYHLIVLLAAGYVLAVWK